MDSSKGLSLAVGLLNSPPKPLKSLKHRAGLSCQESYINRIRATTLLSANLRYIGYCAGAGQASGTQHGTWCAGFG
jgi:hypothetical protein